jgi:tetratricopeptide (TPR) repeat protein
VAEPPPPEPPTATVEVPARIERIPPAQRRARAERLVKQADRTLRRRRYLAAQRVYYDALQHDPDNADASRGMGRALLRRQELDEALAWVRRAVQQEPNRPENHTALADVAEARGDRDGAIAALSAALELYPRDRRLQARLRRLQDPR